MSAVVWVGALSLLLAGQAPRLLHVGIYSPPMIVLYLFALASVARYERAVAPVRSAPGQGSAAAAWLAFAIASAVVVAVGSALPHLAERLVEATGLNRSFVGTLGPAFATSLPEVAVSLGALRLGALDLAIANLLGSNLFNVAVLAIDDLAYLRGPLLADASAVDAATAVTATVMSGLVIVGLVQRPQWRVLRVVFTTAYDNHAIAAFEAGAIDYLLKPISAARLAEAVARLQARLAAKSAAPTSARSSSSSPRGCATPRPRPRRACAG